jgi:hypothetical protein
MIKSLGDFLKNRRDRGENWPTRGLVYQWKFWNYYSFADACVRTIGSKILIDEEAFDRWLLDVAKSSSKLERKEG